MLIAAAAGPSPMWYAARASGFTALLLLSAAIVVGLFTSKRQDSRNWPRFVVQSLHRNLSLLVVVFLIVHVVTSIVDPFAKLSALDAVVPFVATYRPLWLGLGVVSIELIVAITATSLIRHRLGWRTWRAVHMLAYISWPIAVVHGIGTGTDTKSVWALLLTVGCVVAVVGTLVWRLAGAGPRLVALRLLGMAAGIACTFALVAWMVAGPLQPGWAKAAGTPADLLAGGARQTAPSTPPSGLPAGLNDRLSGTLSQSASSETATMTDTRDSTLRLVIVANSDGSGSVTVMRSGAIVCVAPASIGSGSASGQCGAIKVVVQVFANGASLGGTLTTQRIAG